jgi:hypothetical protein
MIALLFLLAAQHPAPLTGTIISSNGTPLAGVNVFVLETLDGSLTNTSGRFVIETAHAGAAAP